MKIKVLRGQTKHKVKLSDTLVVSLTTCLVLVLLVGDHQAAAGGLIDDRCTFRCVTQTIALVIAFECGLAHGRLTLILLLVISVVVFLHQNQSYVLLSAVGARFFIVSLVTILVAWNL